MAHTAKTREECLTAKASIYKSPMAMDRQQENPKGDR